MTTLRCTICHEESDDYAVVYINHWYWNQDEGIVCNKCQDKPEALKILRHKLEQEYKRMMDEKGEPC